MPNKEIPKFEVEKPAKVYFIPLTKDDNLESTAKKTKRIMNESGMTSIISPKKLVAVKQHFGEQGNEGYIKPEITKSVVDTIDEQKGNPLLVETNTLYYGHRSDTHRHLWLAYKHGFTIENVGAPVTILDGIHGQNQKAVPIPGKHFDKVYMVSDLPFFDSMIILSHVKGHMVMGMGAAIKNLGMGLSSRAGKLSQHADFKPEFNEDKCTRCGLCEKYCPEDTITQEGDKPAQVNLDKCVGCGECYSVCRFGAISFQWKAGSTIQEKMAEHAFGAIIYHNKKVGFINIMNHITKECDCYDGKNPVLYDDVGIFAGFDPVAIDQASQDVAKERLGEDIFKAMWPNIDATVQIRHGEEIGMGTQEYELIELS